MSAASPLEIAWVRRNLRVPRVNGAVFAVPPLADMPAAIARNREQIAAWDVSVLGKPLTELRRLAREEVLTAAERFTHQPDAPARASSNSRASDNDDFSLARRASVNVPLIVGGHQPELFHPGVLAKNFMLHRLATATGGVGLHLIVDNDAVASTRIAVPIGSREQPRIEHIPYDTDSGSVPWEEAPLRDESLFRSFADRVSAALACWPIEPLLSEIWPAAIERLPGSSEQPRPRLVDLLTIVRREAERRFGLNNLELPISQLCATQSFAWFLCSLLSDPQRTHAVYNEVVAEYRQVNRVRNRQHPVPDLSTRTDKSDANVGWDSVPTGVPDLGTHADDRDWLEFPFWVWRAGDSRRGRLFVRATSTELQLANGETVITSLSRPVAGAAESAVKQLLDLSSRGWKLRPRALTTTLFVRVFLADAFLHGIGGAKYDEMTDRLIARLFGVAPPSYLTVTSTQHLPLGGWNVTPSDVAALKHRRWDFDHNPERATTTNQRTGGVSPLVISEMDVTRGLTLPVQQYFAAQLTEKRRLIAEQHAQDALDRHDPRRASRAENNQRRRRLRAINHHLAALATDTRSALTAQLKAAQAHLAANEVLQNREFSFCLFSSDRLAAAAQTVNLEA